MKELHSFCRICAGGCGVKVTIDSDDRIVRMRGDPDHPMSRGYACFKGLQAAEAHRGPNRLTESRKRMPDGSYVAIDTERALDEIGERLRVILERDGPDAIAMFCGNGSMASSAAFAMQRAFMAAIGSRQRFSTFTIDQSAKFVSFERMGGWAGGAQQLETSDVLMLFGTNPLVSHSAMGALCVDPTKRLRDARARGLKLIVIDPRRTETARHADVVLQPFPGEDTAIAAAMIRLILVEGWEDKDFCARFIGTERMARLRQEVEPFTLEVAAARAGVEPCHIRQAAELFARISKSGLALTATGPNMAGFSNLSQHMVDLLNVVCGRFPRAGEKVVAIDVLAPPPEYREEVIPAPRTWQAFPPSRIRGVGMLYGERLSGTLADEILTPGDGQIRALIVAGGNPATSIPDQQKIVKALNSLELLVTVDCHMTVTGQLADYVLPATLQYERPDLPFSIPGMAFWPVPWSQYTPQLVKPPSPQIVDDWYVLWSLAKRLGKTIRFDNAVDLDMQNAPTSEELLAIRASRAAIPLDEIKRYPGGQVFDLGAISVLPGRPEADAKFDVMPEDVATELAEYCRTGERKGFEFLIASRRMRDLFNSNGYYLRPTRARNPVNPVSIHPDDMAALGVIEDEEVEIASDNGRVRAIARPDATLRRGVITLSHGWGALPNDGTDARVVGTCINPLISDCRNVEVVNAMPRMSAVPVNIRRLN
ncbi:MAG: molybdopterin-dependent oxidoreductase [Steroidobacteraceae bacterium]